MKQKRVLFHSDLSVLSRYDHPFYHAAYHITDTYTITIEKNEH